MSVVLLVVLIVLGALLLLAILGAAMASRRNALGALAFEQSLASVDRQLAAAVASDRGWERGSLEATARTAFLERRPGAKIGQIELVRMTDEPGTDNDVAVFLVVSDHGSSRLTLGRRDGEWYGAALEEER